MISKVFISCALVLCLFGMSSLAAPLTPSLAETGSDDSTMAELAALSVMLGASNNQAAPEAAEQQAAPDAVVDVETSSSVNNGFVSTSLGGYTFYRVPFTSSTSSNADILATCQKNNMIAPCDGSEGHGACGGCTIMPKGARSSTCGNEHFSYGKYTAPDYPQNDCYKNWPGGKAAWDKFMPDVHIMQNWHCGAGKSVIAVKDNYQPDFSGASRGFALCAVKGRDDTSKYSQVHAAESNQILDLLDGIKAKILAGKNVWSQATLPNAQKALQVSTDALQKAQEQKDIAAASLKKVNDDMQASTSKDDKELDMVEKIQAMVHNLNGRGADTCSNQPDGLVTTKDDGAQMFCKGGMVRIVQALGSDKWSGDYRNIIDRDWFSSGTTKSPSADRSYVLDNLMTQNIIKTSGKWAIEIVRKSDGVTGRVEYTGSPKDVFTCAVSGGHCEMTYAAKFTDHTGVRYSGNTKVCYNTQSKSRGFQGVAGMNFMGRDCAGPNAGANTNCDYGPWASQILLTGPHFPSFSPSFGVNPLNNGDQSYDFFVYVA